MKNSYQVLKLMFCALVFQNCALKGAPEQVPVKSKAAQLDTSSYGTQTDPMNEDEAPVDNPVIDPVKDPVVPKDCAASTINFLGTVKVNDPYGAGSAHTSCTPLMTINRAVTIGAIASGTARTVFVGNPPWASNQLSLSTWDAENCDRSFLFGTMEVACAADGKISVKNAGNLRYYSGRIDKAIYSLRATFDFISGCQVDGAGLKCLGNDPFARISVNGLSVQPGP